MNDSDTPLPDPENVVEEEQQQQEGASPALPGLHVRLMQVFFSPGELAEGLVRRPAWAGALFVSALLVVLAERVVQTVEPGHRTLACPMTDDAVCA